MDNLKVNSYAVNDKLSELRGAAKKIFRSNWKGICLIGFIIYGIMYLPGVLLPFLEGTSVYTVLGLVVAFGSFVLYGHFIWGYLAYIMNCVECKESGRDAVFDGFRHFGKAFCMFALMSLKIFIQVLSAILVSVLSAYFIASLIGMVLGHGNYTYIITMVIFFIGYMAACTFIMLRYSMTFFLGIDYPSAGANMLSKASAILMQGNKKKFFLLQLSMIGWWLLAAAVMVGVVVLLTLAPIGPSIFYILLLLIVMLTVMVPLSGYIMSVSTVFYYVLTGKGKINEEGSLELIEAVNELAEESAEEQASEIIAADAEPVGEMVPVEEEVPQKNSKVKKYILAGVLAVMTIGGGIFAAFDVKEMMGVFDDTYGDFDELYGDGYFDDEYLDELEDYYGDYADIDPDSVLESVEVTDGKVRLTLSNGDGWIHSTEESASYNYMGPDENLDAAYMVEMAYAPYDMFHMASYVECTVDELVDFVDEYWYYADEKVYSGTLNLQGLEAPVTIYYDEYYYYVNVYFGLDSGEAYHIYAVTDTQEEAEDYAKYIEDTFRIL